MGYPDRISILWHSIESDGRKLYEKIGDNLSGKKLLSELRMLLVRMIEHMMLQLLCKR